MEECVLVKLLEDQETRLTDSFRKAFGITRYVALKYIDGNFNRDDAEKGSTIRIMHRYRRQDFTVICEILDVAIVNTIPKVTDLIQLALENTQKRTQESPQESLQETESHQQPKRRKETTTIDSQIPIGSNDIPVISHLSNHPSLQEDYSLLELMRKSKLKEFPKKVFYLLLWLFLTPIRML